jgi:hypothetical protein
MHERGQVRTGLTPVALWCIPSLLGFLVFLIVFLVVDHNLFWTHRNIAEGLFYWCLTIAPATTIIAMKRLKRRSLRKIPALSKAIAWGAIVLSIFLNGFALAGLGVAFYS